MPDLVPQLRSTLPAVFVEASKQKLDLQLDSTRLIGVWLNVDTSSVP